MRCQSISGVDSGVDFRGNRTTIVGTEVPSAKRTANVSLLLTKRAVEALEAADKPWIAWDEKLSGFGVRVHPSGAKSFLINYRAGDGGRKAPNKRVVIGRYGTLAPDRARRQAQKLLGQVADGGDPAGERAEARAMPTLRDAFEGCMASNPNRSRRTDELYRYEANRYLGDWLARPLDAIDRQDVEARFNRITRDHGWSPANRAMSLLRRSTAALVSITMACAIPSICGSRGAASSTARRGARYRHQTKCCPAGAPASKPR
ncbi:MAG: DUF4102 domain-containing protein [Alphaproteobacteria bacterium]|nr:DUF4102 domain-containing protein [Alphaproteobacteria bacterium]